MGLERFRRNTFSVTPFLFALSFSILLTTAAHTQTKPERQSKAAKAAKPGETTQTAQPTAGRRRQLRGCRILQAGRKGLQGDEVSADRSLPRRPVADRRRHSGRSDDLLFRRDWRRSLEVDRRRHDVVVRFSIKRERRRSAALPSRVRITTCSTWARARLAFAEIFRTATAFTERWMVARPGRTWGCETRAPSAR